MTRRIIIHRTAPIYKKHGLPPPTDTGPRLDLLLPGRPTDLTPFLTFRLASKSLKPGTSGTAAFLADARRLRRRKRTLPSGPTNLPRATASSSAAWRLAPSAACSAQVV